MKSRWMVYSDHRTGKYLYRVYRLRDAVAAIRYGDAELFPGWFESEEEAEKLAAELNQKEANT